MEQQHLSDISSLTPSEQTLIADIVYAKMRLKDLLNSIWLNGGYKQIRNTIQVISDAEHKAGTIDYADISAGISCLNDPQNTKRLGLMSVLGFGHGSEKPEVRLTLSAPGSTR